MFTSYQLAQFFRDTNSKYSRHAEKLYNLVEGFPQLVAEKVKQWTKSRTEEVPVIGRVENTLSIETWAEWLANKW